jgi:hypothetical protein
MHGQYNLASRYDFQLSSPNNFEVNNIRSTVKMTNYKNTLGEIQIFGEVGDVFGVFKSKSYIGNTCPAKWFIYSGYLWTLCPYHFVF